MLNNILYSIDLCGVPNAALTVNNITKALQGIDSGTLHSILRIPYSKYQEVKEEFMTEDHCLKALVQFWLLTDPLASWRRIVHGLYWTHDDNFHTIADKIRHYAEELTGTHVHNIILYTGMNAGGRRCYIVG